MRSLYVRYVPWILTLTAVGNLVGHKLLPLSARPVRYHVTGDLTHLVHTEQSTVDVRYGFYLELGDLASGGVLTVPDDSWVDEDLSRGLSNVRLKVRSYDPAVTLIPVSLPQGAVETPEGNIEYWMVNGPETSSFWLGRNHEGWLVIPSTVLPIPRPDDG